jgi:hypothetical protein
MQCGIPQSIMNCSPGWGYLRRLLSATNHLPSWVATALGIQSGNVMDPALLTNANGKLWKTASEDRERGVGPP